MIFFVIFHPVRRLENNEEVIEINGSDLDLVARSMHYANLI